MQELKNCIDFNQFFSLFLNHFHNLIFKLLVTSLITS